VECRRVSNILANITVSTFRLNIFGKRGGLFGSNNGRLVGDKPVIGRNKGVGCYPIESDHVINERVDEKCYTFFLF
jgi:hypothetical protein